LSEAAPVKAGLHSAPKRSSQAQFSEQMRNGRERGTKMKIIDQVKERAATGYILLWLLGIPIPILLLIFLLRGCT
jgi:hypothetical protein